MGRRHTVVNPDAVENYIRGSVMPRFMQRLRDIDAELHRHGFRLQRHYNQLREECEGDPEGFERRWRELAEGWDFAEVNTLIEQHNEYYPIERNLPISMRTGEYLTLSGKPHTRALSGSSGASRPCSRSGSGCRRPGPAPDRGAARQGDGHPARAVLRPGLRAGADPVHRAHGRRPDLGGAGARPAGPGRAVVVVGRLLVADQRRGPRGRRRAAALCACPRSSATPG